MSTFAYTPYDGSAVPFTIGLHALEPKRWIEPDDSFTGQLALKRQLIAENRDAVFQALPQTRASQGELLALLSAHLLTHHPDLYTEEEGALIQNISGEKFIFADYADAPLLLAGQLVQDDLCLIRVTSAGPMLVAASLCFPSSWRLADKIGQHLDDVHAPVPGYAGDMADKVNRMMARLPPDRIVWRMNWSLDEGPDLYRPAPHAHDTWLSAGGDPMDHIWIRVERQTLRRLPESGDIVFTIRIYSDNLKALCQHPQAPTLAKGLHDQLSSMDEAQLAYKGLAKARPTILKALRNRI